MEFPITVEDPLSHSCQALMVGCFEDDNTDPLFMVLDQAVGGCLGLLFKERDFSGKTNKTRIMHTLGKIPAERERRIPVMGPKGGNNP